MYHTPMWKQRHASDTLNRQEYKYQFKHVVKQISFQG